MTIRLNTMVKHEIRVFTRIKGGISTNGKSVLVKAIRPHAMHLVTIDAVPRISVAHGKFVFLQFVFFLRSRPMMVFVYAFDLKSA